MAREAAALRTDFGADAREAVADLRDAAAVAELGEWVVAEFSAIAILCSNAGVLPARRAI